MRSGGQPEMGPHTHTESPSAPTSFLAICTKTKLTTGTSCFFYKKGLCVVLAEKYARLRMLSLPSVGPLFKPRRSEGRKVIETRKEAIALKARTLARNDARNWGFECAETSPVGFIGVDKPEVGVTIKPTSYV